MQVFVMLPVLTSLLLAGDGDGDGKTGPLGEFLVSASIPKGYELSTQDMKQDDKILGTMLIVSKPDQVSKILIQSESREIKVVPARRAAVKGYVNGLATSFAQGGFKIVEKDIPDIEKESFEKAILIKLVFANDEGKKLWVHQDIFFTNNKGFLVQTIAEDPETLASLTKWAKTIKPKPNP